MRRRLPAAASARDTHTEWWWPPSPTVYRTTQAGFSSFEHLVLPEIDPGAHTAVVMVHEFKLAGGGGGFFGLEAVASATDAAVARCAVFSVDGALRGDSGGAEPGSDGGPAWTCRLAYAWEAGRTYGMRLWSDEPGLWSAAVADPAAGNDDVIGRIEVPSTWRQLAGWSVMSTRQLGGPLGRCDDLALLRVAYQEPTANDGRIHPVRHENHFGPGTCENSHIDDVRGGVRHEIGGPV